MGTGRSSIVCTERSLLLFDLVLVPLEEEEEEEEEEKEEDARLVGIDGSAWETRILSFALSV